MPNYFAESERLWLQPLEIEDHLEDLHLITTNSRAMAWSMRKPIKGLEETKEILLNRIPTSEKPWMKVYAILLKSSASTNPRGKPRLIGTCGVLRNEPLGAEIGYGLHPDFWGEGYMSEALNLFINLYWEPDSTNSREMLIAQIDPGNTGSEKVVAKFGFQRNKTFVTGEELVDLRDGTRVPRDQILWYLARPGIADK